MAESRLFFGRKNEPLSLAEWMERRRDRDYCAIARDELHGGRCHPSGVSVSTVWVGMDPNPVPGREPCVFETRVFTADASHALYSPTEELALAAHRKAVDALQLASAVVTAVVRGRRDDGGAAD